MSAFDPLSVAWAVSDALERLGVVLPVPPLEDMLLQKFRWYQKGGRSSDRQRRDIQGIIRVRARVE